MYVIRKKNWEKKWHQKKKSKGIFQSDRVLNETKIKYYNHSSKNGTKRILDTHRLSHIQRVQIL